MDTTKLNLEKLGIVIYLRRVEQSLMTKFVADFHGRWSGTTLVNKGANGDCAFFTIGASEFAVRVRRERVPDSLSNAVLETAVDWRSAKEDLAAHTAHIVVGASPRSSISGQLALASDLTRSIVSLLTVSDAVCVLA